METIRFGCHSFLNAKPIIKYLTENEKQREGISIELGSPAQIAKALSEGRINVGFIPSIEFLRDKDLFLVPGFSISSQGKVMSVLLESRKYIKDIQSIAVDSRSRTSIVLLKIILQKKYGISPVFLSPDSQIGNYRADARLIIGDEALELTYGGKSPYHLKIIDLCEEWYDMTELPFVFALIASKRKTVPAQFVKLLTKSRDKGVRRIGEIAAEEYEKCAVSRDAVVDYLGKRISYTLCEKELEGMKMFQKLAFEEGLIDFKRHITQVETV